MDRYLIVLIVLLLAPPAAARSLCGELEARPETMDATTWTGYECLTRGAAGEYWSRCLRRSLYTDRRGAGCPGAERCCPGDAVVAVSVREREAAEEEQESASEPGSSLFLATLGVWWIAGSAIIWGCIALVLGLFLRGGGAAGFLGSLLGTGAGWALSFAILAGPGGPREGVVAGLLLLGPIMVHVTSFIGAVIGLVVGVKRSRVKAALMEP